MTPDELRQTMLDHNTKMMLTWVFDHPAYENMSIKDARNHADGLASMINRAAQEFHQSMTICEENARKEATQ